MASARGVVWENARRREVALRCGQIPTTTCPGESAMRLTGRLAAIAALPALAALTTSAWADGRDWNDGPVVNSAYIRTVEKKGIDKVVAELRAQGHRI